MSEQIIGPARLQAFSDGVIAIIITIMVLELHVPSAPEPAALFALWPIFVSYFLSYFTVAIYWANHHRLFHLCRHVNNAVLWTNILFLFCLSLIPFATAYLGQMRFTSFAAAVYGACLLLPNLAFVPMRLAVAAQLKDEPDYARVHRRSSIKGYVSHVLYAASIPAAYVHPALTLILAFIVAAIYFLPNAWLGEKHH